MSLRQLRDPLRDEVMSLKHEKTFEEARAREPTLAAHASILSVLAVMNDESERRYAEREALTRALVREQQERPGPFWAAVLLIAYAPMLLRLRGRICGDAFARDDLDQMALEAFLEAVGRFPLTARPTRVAMYLRQDTQRAVFRRLRAEQQARLRLTVLEEEALSAEEFDLFASGASEQPLDDDEREELVAMLVARVGDRVPPAKLEVVIATHLRGERLRDYVARRHGDLADDAREVVYQRLKRERLRTLDKLRPLFGEDVSLPPAEPALPMQSAAL
jgi:hypothetical protein